MKTLEEIKKGLECLLGMCEDADCDECSRNVYEAYEIIRDDHIKDALTCIRQLESSYSQVSKALCGKENATLEEVLQAVSQVKVELAFVTLERDALFSEIKQCNDCYFCKHYGTRIDVEPCQTCILDFQQQDFKPGFEWRGVCPENTDDDRSCVNCKHQGAEGRGICMDCSFDYKKWEPLESTEVRDND